MPIIGFVDPSHYERSHAKAGRLPNWYSVDDLIERSLDPNPKWSPWTYELVKAVLEETQDIKGRGDRISATTLTAPCPRAEILKRKVDFIASLDDLYRALRGTMIHRTLERYTRATGIAEATLVTTVDGIRLSGSPDLLTPDVVYDYKTTDNPPPFGYPYRHHTEQVQLYAFIARHVEEWSTWDTGEKVPNGKLPFDPRTSPVKRAVVAYLGPKGPKLIEVQRKEEMVTPTGAVREAKRPYIWDDERILEEFRPKLYMVKQALEVYPDWPAGAWRSRRPVR